MMILQKEQGRNLMFGCYSSKIIVKNGDLAKRQSPLLLYKSYFIFDVVFGSGLLV